MPIFLTCLFQLWLGFNSDYIVGVDATDSLLAVHQGPRFGWKKFNTSRTYNTDLIKSIPLLSSVDKEDIKVASASCLHYAVVKATDPGLYTLVSRQDVEKKGIVCVPRSLVPLDTSNCSKTFIPRGNYSDTMLMP